MPVLNDTDLNVAMNYMFQCFIASEDTFTHQNVEKGPEAIYTGTVESPRILLSRTDLPGGPLGDEMWYRLTVGLERHDITW